MSTTSADIVDFVAAALAGDIDPAELGPRDRRAYDSAVRVADRAAREAERLAAAAAAGCKPCEYAVRHGWWGPLPDGARTHCRTCHRSWSSVREVHCVVCCEQFISGTVAEKHRRDGACLNPAEELRTDGQPRFVARERRSGTTWALAFYGTRPSHWGTPAP